MKNSTFAEENSAYQFPMSDPLPSEEKRPLCRRGFLTMLALAGGGLFIQRKPEVVEGLLMQAKDYLASIPVPTIRSLREDNDDPATRTAYAAFLAAIGLENIAASTILNPHFNRHGAVQNSLPPEKLWQNLIPTLRVVDTMAGELNERVKILSAYRSPAYNATCPGAAKFSQHLRNKALDIQFRSPPAKVAALARKLRSQGLFRGGVGLYPNFTHIDTRGFTSDW